MHDPGGVRLRQPFSNLVTEVEKLAQREPAGRDELAQRLYGGTPIEAWAGPYQGTQLIDGAAWRPYIQTPPFAEYVSGHSRFSAAAATVLTLFTGSKRFGLAVTIPALSSPLEPGAVPASDVTLAWSTFDAAADEAGLSRRLGGIHFIDGDMRGRHMGKKIGQQTWAQARACMDGRIK